MVFTYVVEDDTAAEWVHTHIIDAVLKPDWKKACNLFTEHFQTSDYTATLRQQYRDCKQQKGESVQEYSDRFTDICTQLGIDDSSFMSIDQFTQGLYDPIARRYHNFIADECARNELYQVTSLCEAIRLCIRFDVANRTAYLSGNTAKAQNRDSSVATDQSSKYRSSSHQYCSFHKVNTHSTAECKTLNYKKQHPSSDSGSSVKHENKSNDKKKSVTCYS